MNHLRAAVVLSLLLGPLLSGSAEAMVRKCRSTPGGLPIRTTTPLLIVNGEVMGDLPASTAADGAPVRENSAIGSIKSEDILRIDVVCLEIIEGGAKVGRAVVSIVTRAGAVPFMRSQLKALVQQQEAYRARTGGYARDLTSLEFFATRPPLPIDMQMRDGGWSAKVELGASNGCQVVVETGGAAPTVACDPG